MTKSMAQIRKLKILVLYGGRSGEHEISLRSAASVINSLDVERFDVVPVAIDKDGRWLLNDISIISNSSDSLPIWKNAPRVILPPNPNDSEEGSLVRLETLEIGSKIDVVFPVMHGPLCEDGTIQGLLELANVPYVGSGVLASAVAMDKDVTKRLLRDAGLPVVPFIAIKKETWTRDRKELTARIINNFEFPIFIKPANLGSSVGVNKAKNPDELESCIDDAFSYDTKVLVERFVPAREIELAVLENPIAGDKPLVSVPGEIIPTSSHSFYSYEAKYLDENGAELMIPAQLTPEQTEQAQTLAQDVFTTLDCEGMGRVDLFMDKETGKFYVNEINTIPGFTSISMYPKLWEYSGINYSELLSRLIDLAIFRHQRKTKLVRDYLMNNAARS